MSVLKGLKLSNVREAVSCITFSWVPYLLFFLHVLEIHLFYFSRRAKYRNDCYGWLSFFTILGDSQTK